MAIFGNNIVCATSTIADGNMGFRFGEKDEVLTNRTTFLEKNGLTYDNCISMRSEHEDLIVVVDDTTATKGVTSREDALHADVLVTQTKGLALLLTTADCQAVSFYDPVTGTIALAHISRHTLSQNLAQKTIGFLREVFAVDPANLLIHISPHIMKDSYKFALPLQSISPLLAPFIEERGAFAHIDTLACSLQQLTTSGVQRENISFEPIDTVTSPNHFSYYRATKEQTQDGRMATILAIQV